MIAHSFCLHDSCILSHSCNSIVKLYFVVQYGLSVRKLVDLLKSIPRQDKSRVLYRPLFQIACGDNLNVGINQSIRFTNNYRKYFICLHIKEIDGICFMDAGGM